jgi:hypothetical protein
MSSNNIYCVYLTVYSGNKLPPFYIGSSSTHKISSGYRGSVKSKKYKTIWEYELKHNNSKFKCFIIAQFKTKQEALNKECKLQKTLNVAKSPLYINMSLAAPKGFFGMDVSKENNPNYNNKWTDEQKLHASKTQIELRKQFPDKYYTLPPMFKENNPRWKDGKTTFKDKDGNTVFTSINDPRVLSKELVGVGTNVEKVNQSKAKNPNLKKYEYIIIQTPLNSIIKLEWNEYGNYFKQNNLRSIPQLKNGFKGFKLIEAKLNPNCRMVQPIKVKQLH